MLLFKDIKQNYPVYILDTQEFSLIQGKATQVSFPRLEMNQKTGKTEMVVDVTYAANMAYADFYPDPLKDEAACLRYAYKVANDPDGYEGMIFCRWTADAIGKAISINWEKFI